MHNESWILFCTSEQPWQKMCWDLASSSSLGCAEGRWGFQFPRWRKELSAILQEAPAGDVSKILSHTPWNGQGVLEKRGVRQHTLTNEVHVEVSKSFPDLTCSPWSGFEPYTGRIPSEAPGVVFQTLKGSSVCTWRENDKNRTENGPWKTPDTLNVSMQCFEIFCQAGTIIHGWMLFFWMFELSHKWNGQVKQ